MSTITRIPWTGVESGRNYATAPRAGTGSGWTVASWGTGGAGTINLNGSTGAGNFQPPVENMRAMSIIWTTAPSVSVGAKIDTGRFPILTGGTPMTHSGYLASTIAGAQWRAVVQWYNASNVLISSSTGPITTPTAENRGRISVTATAPAGATQALFGYQLMAGTIVVGSFAWFTAVQSEAGTTPSEWFDGNLANRPLMTFTWAGAVDASASIRTVPAPGNAISPPIARAPYTAARESRTLVHTLLEQSTNLFTYRPPAPATGVLDLQFPSYAAALSARDFLVGNYAYAFETAPLGGPTVFRVAGGDLELAQDERITTSWHVLVPWAEAAA